MSGVQPKQPPKLALKLLRWFCNPDLIEDVEGDVSELFAARSGNKAIWLFYWDVFLLYRPGIIKDLNIYKGQNNNDMFNNYLKIALRNALRYKGYTLLNLLGLVVGIASSMLVLLWVNDEVSIDKFHSQGESIYKVFRNMNQSNGQVSTTASTPKPLADVLNEEYSEVSKVASLSWPMGMDLELEAEATNETGRYASQEFLDMFSFELLIGNRNTALDDLSSILISETVALKLFGDKWKSEASGQVIKVNEETDVLVSGVFKDIGSNSTLGFDWLMPAQSFFNQNDWVNDWGNGSFEVYLLIPDESQVQAVSKRIYSEIKDNTAGNASAGDESLILQKFQDTYLYSNFKNGAVVGGRIDYVQIMTIVAFFILIVACINFMNLTTARSSRRSKEIGLRKVMGAPRKSIRTQFYFEAFLLTTIAVVLSVLVVLLLMPVFNNIVDKSLFIDFSKITTWYFLIGLTLVVGLLSGSYPAIILPAIDVLQSIKGGAIKQSSFAVYFRKGLVVFQFAISTLLIIGTAVIYQQINFVLNKDLGMNKDNLLAVNLEEGAGSRLEAFKSELMRLPSVTNVSGTSGNPLDYGRSTSSANWEGKSPADGYEVNIMLTDDNFIETTGMKILKGRDFSNQLKDSTNFLINEVAAKLMGFDDPIGKKLSFWGINGQVVGVVKNFHMSNLYEPIAPLIITCLDPSMSDMVLIRTSENAGAVLPQIEEVTKALSPNTDFDYLFIDQAYAESYKNEKTMRTLANIFALVSVIISTLGLLGLASYSAEQRSKEIGVRKVHGASVIQVLILLSKDYSKLILIAFFLAIPFAYYLTEGWLAKFEFRTELNPLVFILGGLIVFVIGIFTVAGKSYYAATVNPAKVLKES